MKLSVLLPSLPGDFHTAVRQAAQLGFDRVDVVAVTDRPDADLEALADAGVVVSCGALGRGLPDGHTLDAVAADVRRATAELTQRQVADLARLGATHAYLVPGLDGDAAALARFTDGVVRVADFAARRMIRLCVEHTPGRALLTVAATLDWLERVDHANLALLLDVGHCLLSREEPGAAIRRAGARLGYLHLDDNDGQGDLHLPLKAGLLDDSKLREALRALAEIGYGAALALELKPAHGNAVEAVRQGKELLERLARS